jgi:hypothetical protein
MSEQFIPHPPSPNPEKKDTVTFNKKNVAISFLVAAVALLILVISVSGGDNDTSSTVSTEPPAPIVTDPPANKYDLYYDHVITNSGLANSWAKSDVIKFGDLVCQSLDEGNTVNQVADLLNSYVTDSSNLKFFATVMYGSIKFICPQYMPDLDFYLNS